MIATADILVRAREALESEPRIDLHRTPVEISCEDGALCVAGELDDVAAKKRALERLVAIPGVDGIVDRLRVCPAQPMEDGEIRDLVRDALLQEPAFADLALFKIVKGELAVVRDPVLGRTGDISVSVEDGVVTLDGDVPGLGIKRLAGVLAWWVPGSRDVVNGLGVTPPEEDSDDEITDAVRIALEKDPFVDAAQIRVHTSDRVVVLDGIVPSGPERDMAEYDAWYVFGVDGVTNRIRTSH